MPIPVPYLLDFLHPAVDDAVAFVIAALIAITINAAAQGFMAILLGDTRPDNEKRLHLNPFLYIDVLGIICFLVAGFGWAKAVDVNAGKFTRPRLFTVLTRFAGPVANFLMAGIAGSIVWMMSVFGWEDRVFPIVIAVNLAVAVYHILPIPPLAGASLIPILFPRQDERFHNYLYQAGPYVLVGIFLMERISGSKFLSSFLDPIVKILFDFVLG